MRRCFWGKLVCCVGAEVVTWSMVADSEASASPHLTELI